MRSPVNATYIVEGALNSRSIFVFDTACQVFENRGQAFIPIRCSMHISDRK
jgi:hypothetical protein